MCGIGGIVTRGRTKFDPRELHAMAERLRHRGPDGRGFATYTPGGEPCASHEAAAIPPGTVGLMHLRLSIIDTSEGGWQPMRSADGRYYIVFNGEIYNFIELREELAAAGHVFRSSSDTEVLLAAWAEWGPRSLTRLVGMFAFAILDTTADTLTFARDGFGIKPLFWFADADRFAFASELKGLIPLKAKPHRANASRVFSYLRRGVTDTGGETMIEGIFHVPPGHWGHIPLGDPTKPEFTPFWVPKSEPIDISYDEAVRRTRDLFTRSVDLHLRSDVPVGACLSGGIDSSAIVATMRALKGEGLDLHTFTYAAETVEDSEERWATLVAEQTGAHQHRVTPRAADLPEDLETLIQCQDEPFGSTTIYAQHRVFRLVAEHGIKVVLDGQGADELLGGYAHHSGARLAALIRGGKLRSAFGFWRSMPPAFGGGRYGRAFAAQYLLPASAHGPLRRLIGRSEVPPWLNASWFEAAGAQDSTAAATVSIGLTDELVSNVRNELPTLLRYEDRNSMHFSIESRVPFLTPELSDFFLSLPEHYVIANDGTSKAVLKSALRGIVPDAILDRRDKVGFRTPEWEWMRTIRPWAEGVLASDVARAIPVFRHDELRRAWTQALANPGVYNTWVWRWLNFIRWSEVNGIEF